MSEADAKTITTNAKSNLAFALLCLPKERRRDMVSFYAFCRIIDDITDKPEWSDQERIKMLGDWRHGLINGFQDPGPVEMATEQLRDKYNIPTDLFLEIIDGMEMDVGGREYQTFEDLQTYCYRVACVVGLISVEIFGAKDPKSKEYAVSLGYALQLTNILRDLGEDFAMGRVYLPLEELEHFGIEKENLLDSSGDDSFLEMMEFQAERAESFFREAGSLLPAIDYSAMRAARCMGRIYHLILKKMRRDQFQVFDKRYRVGRLRMLAILVGL